MVADAVAKAEEETAEQHQAEEEAEDGAGAEGELAVCMSSNVVVVEKIVHKACQYDTGWEPGLVAQVEADCGFVGIGVLQDGEVVQAVVGVQEEELAEASPHAKVWSDVLLDAGRVIVDSTCMAAGAFAAVSGGFELNGAGARPQKGLEAKDRMRWVRDITQRELVCLGLNLEVVGGAAGDAAGTGVVLGITGVAAVELKADIGLCRVADGYQCAESVGSELRNGLPGVGGEWNYFAGDRGVELTDAADAEVCLLYTSRCV